MRACLDAYGADSVVVDPIPFIDRECRTRMERAAALEALRKGLTFQDPRGHWSLTPIQERTQ
jgi:hypothetical protein